MYDHCGMCNKYKKVDYYRDLGFGPVQYKFCEFCGLKSFLTQGICIILFCILFFFIVGILSKITICI